MRPVAGDVPRSRERPDRDRVLTVSARRVVAAVVALALGGFPIGTTEFVTMGLLPDIADGVDVDIPTAGHVISAYALGVVVVAPVLAALGARLPRRGLLVGLMAAFLLGNVGSALAPGSSARCSPGSSAASRTGRISASRRWSPHRWCARSCGAGRSAR
jgi:MFS family permease